MLKLTKKEFSVLDVSSCAIPFTRKPSSYCVVCISRSTGNVVFVERFNSFRNALRIRPSDYDDANLFLYRLSELY